RNIGSTSKGIKISSYKGNKTISPLKSYKVIKKFGKFYDPVYKIELFNESISLKSKQQNAKVYNIIKGKVVYAKHDAGELGNVVIVKHRNNLHTIYSQLSNIPKTLKVGQWIKKGYVVGRVKDTLVFQVTRDNKYLDPQKLFK
ncbi:MAG: M23 family metallopeptidase, partial [Arcobacteraceae bacterium]|nr:M23 family metallopeptidase [Arcobacteraceae bacterium]